MFWCVGVKFASPLSKLTDEQRRIVLKKISVQKRIRNRMTETAGRWGKNSKVHPITCLAGPEGGQRCNYTLYLTLVLGGSGCSTPRLRSFSPWNDLVPILYEAGWTSGPVWTGVENLGPNGIRSQIVQPIANPYTDWAIPAHNRTVRSSVMCINGVINSGSNGRCLQQYNRHEKCLWLYIRIAS